MRIGEHFGTLPRVEEDRKLGGRYRLLNELGRGGMAVVWRALDEVLGRPVAVKVLAGHYADDPRSRARILQEARSAATLSHPNIAQIYDFGESEEDGRPVPYVVMELINGPTLQQRVARGRIPPRTVFRICGEVAAALAAAHEDGLVHRDIKLANIMVTPTGAKVVDFGIAAEAGPASPEDALLGTPAYLAPERLTGGAVEPASDVYALGVLLYRLLAGAGPWSVETTTQMLRAHVYQEPVPLPALPGVPDAIADLVTACLAKNPADRPGAAEASGALGDAAEAASAAQPDPVRETGRDHRVGAVDATGDTSDRFQDSTELIRRPALGPSGRGDGHGAPDDGAGVVPPWWKRRKVLAAAGVAALLIALPALRPDRDAAPQAAPGPAAPPTASPAVTKSRPGAAGAPRPAAMPTGSGRRSGPSGSASAPQPPQISAPSSAPSSLPGSVAPSVTSSEPAAKPSTAAPPPAPEGTRLESPGGFVVARCGEDGAELTAWEPKEGFSVERADPGPALTTAVVFAGDLMRFRMTVTCFAGRPSAVVLPL